MGLFGKKPTSPQSAAILILGGGCKSCITLENSVRAALTTLGINEEIGHVTDFAAIAAYGVMTTPALIIDGAVVSCGRVLSVEEAAAAVKKARKL